MKLTDTQLVLLSAASQREDRGIELAPNLKGGAAQKLIHKLLTEGLIEEVRAAGSLPIWRREEDNQPLALRITKRGLAAIQVDDGEPQPDPSNPARRSKGPISHLTSFPAGSRLLVARRPGARFPYSRASPAG
jgi:hypothetical protein